MARVHQHHGDERDVIRSSECGEHEKLRHQPVAAIHRRRKHALDKSIDPRTRDHSGGDRDEPKRDQAVGDDAVSIEPLSCVPTVASPPTASKTTAAPNHANRPRIVALSSSVKSVATERAMAMWDGANDI